MVGLCCAAELLVVALALTQGIGLHSRPPSVSVVIDVLAVAVVATSWRTARRAPSYNRRVWRSWTLAGACWSVSEVCQWLGPPWGGGPERPGLSDAALVLSTLPTALALLTIPPEPRTSAESRRVWLGCCIVLASVVLFSRSMMLHNHHAPHPTGWLLVLQVAYPLSDAVVASLVWIALLRVGTLARMPLFLVSAGLLLQVWANAYFWYAGPAGLARSGPLLDAAGAARYLLFILAALSPNARSPRQPSTPQARARYVGFAALVVYLPVLAGTLVASTVKTSPPDRLLVVDGLVVLVLFGARQVLLAVDNNRLRDALESRVEDLVQRTAELRRLVLQNERIVQSVVDGVIGVDARGVLTFVNPAAASMLGSTREELLGRGEDEIFHGHHLSGDHHLLTCEPLVDCCLVANAMSTGTAASSDSQSFVRRDGRAFPVELAVGPILEDQQITGAVVVFRDVTARHRLEKLKNEFVSVVSHELRTPLTSIRGSLGLLAGGAAGQLSSQGERMVKVALESSERLARLVNDMLDIERIESEAVPVELAACDPARLVGQAVDELRALVAGHRMAVQVATGTTRVRADADRIVQTLTNLIGNAVKFSPAGTTITVSAISQGDGVEFAVSDEGRGIPADKISKIFERFEQVDSSDSREMGGTGLGLAISRAIVRRHGGELSVASQPGTGSVFRFALAAVETAAPLELSRAGWPA